MAPEPTGGGLFDEGPPPPNKPQKQTTAIVPVEVIPADPPPPKDKKQRGRPKFDLNEHLQYIEKMAAIGMTQEDMGWIIGCSPDTLQREAKKKNSQLFASLSRGRAAMRFKLRARLFYKAMHGEPAWGIFACKTQLGLSEKQEVVVIPPEGMTFGRPAEIDPAFKKQLSAWAKAHARELAAG